MQTKTKKILIPLGLVGGMLIINKVLQVGNFLRMASVELKNINIKSENLKNGDYSKIVFDLILILKNPTNLSGKIKSIDINVFANGKKIGNLASAKSFDILPHKAISFHNDITLRTATLTTDLYSVIINAIESKQVNFNFVGTIKTNLGSINVNQKQIVTA